MIQTKSPFIPNHDYKRSFNHDEYRGSRQGENVRNAHRFDSLNIPYIIANEVLRQFW